MLKCMIKLKGGGEGCFYIFMDVFLKGKYHIIVGIVIIDDKYIIILCKQVWYAVEFLFSSEHLQSYIYSKIPARAHAPY